MADIFVFGSNLAGRHGKGSALEAFQKHGAAYGVGVGRFGASYAIPTKDRKLKTLPSDTIGWYVELFLRHVAGNSDDTFNVVAIGCGLAGYKPEIIAPMFENAPRNVNLPQEFIEVLGASRYV